MVMNIFILDIQMWTKVYLAGHRLIHWKVKAFRECSGRSMCSQGLCFPVSWLVCGLDLFPYGMQLTFMYV